MKFSRILFSILLSAILLPATAFAVVGVSSGELQNSSSIIVPNGSSLGTLEGYGAFTLQSTTNVSGGLKANYKARLTEDPWLNEELPQIQILTYAYADQASAQYYFDYYLTSSFSGSSSRELIDSDDRWFYYNSETSKSADVFNTINAEYTSLHLLHVNGNIIYQASLFRENGQPDHDNLQAFVPAIEQVDYNRDLLESAIDSEKLALTILFPPTGTDLTAKSSKSYLNLSELYSIPSNGSVTFDVYIGESEGAVGTILDSSGISSAEAGDMYLYLDSTGKLYAGIYAPNLDSDCTQESGWYRISTSSGLHAYEWNEITLHWGVGGFWLSLNGVETVSCGVSQQKSSGDLFFGDYPYDSIEESMIGYLDDLSFSYSTTDSGQIWDTVLENQLFLDLPDTDEDLVVFQHLKELGIFTGSNGYLYPDKSLNRAEMVKVLLKTYGYSNSDASSVIFWDVPSDAWYLKYLAKAYEIGMIEGNPDGSFSPGKYLNRAEFYTMLYRAADAGKFSYSSFYTDVPTDTWYYDGAAFAAAYGLIDSDYFSAAHSVTRRSAAKSIYALLQ
jgi:hypothetical protein